MGALDRYGIGHNGGPALETSVRIQLGEKFLFLFDAARHKAFYGGRGGAKSHSIAIYLVLVAAQSRKRIVCARQFQNSLRDSAKELIEIKIRELGLTDQFKVIDREIVHRTTGSRFTFIGLDRNPDSIKSLEGADICWVEEASTVSLAAFEKLIPTVRKPGSEIIWSWNPDKRTDPVDQYFRGDVRPPNSIIVEVGFQDNPWFYQTEMPAEMLFMQVGNPLRFRHIWLGGYDDSFEGRIFTNVSVGRLEVSDYVQPLYGLDFGFGQDPSSIVKVYVLEDQKKIYVARERTARVALDDLPALINDVTDGDPSATLIADSSNPGAIGFLTMRGFRTVPSVKGPGSVKSGINWLQGYQIIIDPDCGNLREEAKLYTWVVDKRTQQVTSTPVDKHNHSWDAVRYATEECRGEGTGRGGAMILRR